MDEISPLSRPLRQVYRLMSCQNDFEASECVSGFDSQGKQHKRTAVQLLFVVFIPVCLCADVCFEFGVLGSSW